MMVREFASLGEFAAFMRRAVVFEKIADIDSRALVAHELTEEVRRTIGDPDKLPPPLAQSTQDEREKAGFSPNETLLRTGELQDSIGWDHESTRLTIVGSTDPKAVWHEFGPTNNHFPQRSFMASTASAHNERLFALYVETFERTFRPI